MGTDPEPLLRAADFLDDALSHPENIIPLDKVSRFIMACAERTGQSHFGLLVGQRVVIEQYGLVGLRVLHAPTVGAAWC
jgi:hypothetical protein